MSLLQIIGWIRCWPCAVHCCLLRLSSCCLQFAAEQGHPQVKHAWLVHGCATRFECPFGISGVSHGAPAYTPPVPRRKETEPLFDDSYDETGSMPSVPPVCSISTRGSGFVTISSGRSSSSGGVNDDLRRFRRAGRRAGSAAVSLPLPFDDAFVLSNSAVSISTAATAAGEFADSLSLDLTSSRDPFLLGKRASSGRTGTACTQSRPLRVACRLR